MKSNEIGSLRICLVHCPLQSELRGMGHKVLDLHPGPGIVDLPGLLEKHAFVPDLVVQQETLGPRTLLSGLDNISCPKVYWSVDTHLNAFWQEEYARLFDLTCSTQAAWARHLRDKGIVRTAWLPWFGRRMPWTPWKDRRRPMAFVGRVTEHRPTRQRFVRHLQRCFALETFQDLNFRQMLEVYQDTRLAPNESICGEINFRLFEAASCGCLVVNPSGIEGLENLFTPEHEIATYAHSLDLDAKLTRFLNNPGPAERLAKAAWARVQEAHLPVCRARTLLALARDCPGATKHDPAQARLSWALTLYRLWQADRAPVPETEVRRLLLNLPESGRKRSALLGFWLGSEKRETLVRDLAALLQSEAHADDALVNQSASLAALVLEDFATARAFWMRGRALFRGSPRPPRTPCETFLFWARELQRRACPARPGLPYDHQRHLPESSLECLIMAHRLDPADMNVCRRMDALLDKQPGFEPLRLSLLSQITLHQPQDWLAGLKLGLVNLQGFRLQQGLEELHLAEHRAGKRNELSKFHNSLAVIDPAGLIRQALGHAPVHTPPNTVLLHA